MKKLTILFILISGFIYSQKKELNDDQLNYKLDSLNINYEPEIKHLTKAKNDVTDLFNILIFNGDYSKDLISRFTKELNSVQEVVVFEPKITSEKSAIDIRDRFSEIIDLKVKAAKYKLIGNEILRRQDEIEKENIERVLLFLRESKFSPSEFKKLKFSERMKLVENFEMEKQGITSEIINYYNSMNDDEKFLFDQMIKKTKKQTISSEEIKKYQKLIDDKVIYKNSDWNNDYFPTLNLGEKILNYLKYWKPKGY